MMMMKVVVLVERFIHPLTVMMILVILLHEDINEMMSKMKIDKK